MLKGRLEQRLATLLGEVRSHDEGDDDDEDPEARPAGVALDRVERVAGEIPEQHVGDTPDETSAALAKKKRR